MRTVEPVSDFFGDYEKRVYPRAYGGTFNDDSTRLEGEGLSPCVRGNREDG